MKVLLVSTWKQPCGIATYTQDLVRALQMKGAEVFVAAERIKQEALEKLPPNVRRCWDRNSFKAEDILQYYDVVQPDIVHIQHEHGLFVRDTEFVRLLQKVRTVTTLHTVDLPPNRAPLFHVLGGYPTIVHTNEAEHILRYYGSNFHVIPHGLWLRPQKPGEIFLVPGFVSSSKNHTEILEAYMAALEVNPDLPRMKISGLCRDFGYERKLRETVEKFGLVNHVDLDLGWKEEMDTKDACAIILGNGKSSPYSASGQLHTALGLRIPIIAKNVPIYRGNTGVYYFSDEKELKFYLLGHHILKPAPFAANRLWENVAESHINLYNSLCS